MLGEYIASAPLTPLVKHGGGIRPIAMGTVWRRLVSKAWYLDDDTIVGDTLVVRKVQELIMKDGPRCGLHLNVEKLLGGPASVDFDVSSEIVMKRVAKTIDLMDAVSWINDPQSQHSFDVALRSALERLVTASGPGFGDWQWRLATLPFTFRELGVSPADSGPTFDDALFVFNTSMKTGILSNPSEIAALKLMKKFADIYFTRVTNTAESTFFLSHRQMALWKSQMEDHTSNWLRAVLISGLRQTMNDHVVSCAGIVGIKHRHNIMRDTLVDICYRSGISASKEIDIGLEGGHDKPLRLAYMILYSWDEGLDVCVDLTGSSPLKQTGMADFAYGRAVIDAAYNEN
nr:hypothetical protein [Tanacetum cinerariifolium]